jgi:hypothetical protein
LTIEEECLRERWRKDGSKWDKGANREREIAFSDLRILLGTKMGADKEYLNTSCENDQVIFLRSEFVIDRSLDKG